MTAIAIQVAVEDEVSEAVITRLLAGSQRPYVLPEVLRGQGFGHLRRTIRGWNHAAKGSPWLVLTDLDQEECPSALLARWLPTPKHPNLLFRVAVREIESWILTDRTNFAAFLGISAARIPAAPDDLVDPKQTLVNLARKARPRMRDRVVPRARSTAQQGPDYNACLGEFVMGAWDATAAAEASPSLRRTIQRLTTFTPT